MKSLNSVKKNTQIQAQGVTLVVQINRQVARRLFIEAGITDFVALRCQVGAVRIEFPRPPEHGSTGLTACSRASRCRIPRIRPRAAEPTSKLRDGPVVGVRDRRFRSVAPVSRSRWPKLSLTDPETHPGSAYLPASMKASSPIAENSRLDTWAPKAPSKPITSS